MRPLSTQCFLCFLCVPPGILAPSPIGVRSMIRQDAPPTFIEGLHNRILSDSHHPPPVIRSASRSEHSLSLPPFWHSSSARCLPAPPFQIMLLLSLLRGSPSPHFARLSFQSRCCPPFRQSDFESSPTTPDPAPPLPPPLPPPPPSLMTCLSKHSSYSKIWHAKLFAPDFLGSALPLFPLPVFFSGFFFFC